MVNKSNHARVISMHHWLGLILIAAAVAASADDYLPMTTS